MRFAALTLTALIGALHTYIAWFEIFAWETRGPNVFTSFDTDLFSRTVDMAANQGLYNSFLAAGLFWSLFIGDRQWHQLSRVVVVEIGLKMLRFLKKIKSIKGYQGY